MPSDAAAQDPAPSAADVAPRAGPSDHDHGPSPSFEWILNGKRDTVLPHLKTIAPTMQWQDRHFHVRDVAPRAEDWPELFQIELDELPVGALDFMSLPGDRTLMRLYLCSDLGAACPLENGNDVIQGFATAWLARLDKLGFLISKGPAAGQRPLGFQPPPPTDA